MKKIFFFIILCFSIVGAVAQQKTHFFNNYYNADFSITEGEQTLWFKITSDSTVTVVPNAFYEQNDGGNSGSHTILTMDTTFFYGYDLYCYGVSRMDYASLGTENVVIPATVTYNDIMYNVTAIHGGIMQECSYYYEGVGYDYVNQCRAQKIKSLAIPETVKEIGDGLFSNMNNIDILYINTNNISIIGTTYKTARIGGYNGTDYTYEDTVHINKIVLGPNVRSFSGVFRVDSVELLSDSCVSVNFSHPRSIINGVIGDSVKYIPSYIFQDSKIPGINLPNSVLSIGKNAFQGCSELLSVDFGVNISTIDTAAFQGCTNLTTIELDSSLNTIGNYAFQGCSNLSSLEFGNSPVVIGNYAFQGCSNLSSLEFGNSPVVIGDYAFQGCSNLSSLEIGNSSMAIGDYAFVNCDNLVELIFGDSALSIGNHTFENLNIADNLFIPNNLESIGDYAFANCDNILQVDWDSPTPISNYVFSNCDRLVTVNIEDNTPTIGNYAFSNCSRLTNVMVGNSVTSISTGSFQNCPRLSNVHFGESVSSIGQNAFANNTRLEYSTLPNSLNTIGMGAFQNCTSFQGEIVIPENVATIGNSAFSGCGGITSLRMRPVTPPTIAANTFNGVDVNIPVYVPCGRVLYYYVADNWENFPNLLEAEPYEVTVSSNDEMMGTAEVSQRPTCANPRARLTATAQEGYHFLQWNDGNLAVIFSGYDIPASLSGIIALWRFPVKAVQIFGHYISVQSRKPTTTITSCIGAMATHRIRAICPPPTIPPSPPCSSPMCPPSPSATTTPKWAA